MDSQLYIQTLRLHLLDMARVCQRGTDYAIKAYKLPNSDCCFGVHDETYEIDILHREILAFRRELLLAEISEEPALRFVLSADRICNALKAIHTQAVDMTGTSMRLLESNRAIDCRELISMGDVVNGLMRLCVVALFEEEIVYAATVLQSTGVERKFQKRFFDWFRSLDRHESTQAGYEVAIARCLSQMTRELLEVANAIEFWLNDSEYGWGLGTEPCMSSVQSHSAEN